MTYGAPIPVDGVRPGWTKPLPDQDTLLRLFAYDHSSGRLRWRQRGEDLMPVAASRAKWNAKFAHREVSALDRRGYVTATIFGRRYFAHRLIWKMVNGEDPACIDHINGDRSDNRIVNLRSVSIAENLRNTSFRRDNKSGVMGVYWSKSERRWKADIHVDKRKICLGTFRSKDDAASARRSAEVLFGFHPNHGKVSNG